jgi:hypothetical protein
MLRPVLIGLLSALVLAAQSHGAPSKAGLEEYLAALGRTAATFSATAPGLVADETLDQRGRRGFVEILRGKKNQVKDLDIRLPKEFRTHNVVSTYKLEEAGEGHVLHEVRTIVTMDGESLTESGEARHAMTIGSRSTDDEMKRRLLENLEQEQLEGAVTDFGQLILLFTARLQKDYEFSLEDSQNLNGEPAVILRYRQVAGDQGLTFFRERTEERQTAAGEIWLRAKDFLPVRITLNTEEVRSKKFTIRTEATIDYQASRFGLVPGHVVHRQFLNTELMVENDLRYANFRRDHAMIP